MKFLIWLSYFCCPFLQIIPEELGDAHNPGDSEGTAFLPVQPSTREGELKLHLSDDEDDDDDDDEDEFENDFEKGAEEEEEPEDEKESGKDQDQTEPEVDEDQAQTQGEENGEQEVESDISQAPGAPEQEDPEAVALKKRTYVIVFVNGESEFSEFSLFSLF